MKKLCLLVLLAACGNKSKGTAVTPEPTTPDAGATAVEPTAAPDAGTTAEAPDPKAALLEAELLAYADAQPVLDAACARCHSKEGQKSSTKKLDHFDMTTYPLGGHHTATITTTLRHVLGIDGAKPKMPADKPGTVTGDDLALIAAWADAYDAAEQAGAHEGQPGYTPAE